MANRLVNLRAKNEQHVILQAFETQLSADGSLWRTIGERAKSCAALGISALWIPPAWKGAGGGGANGYDVYDLYDLGEFHQKGSVRTKFGTREELLAAIRALHRVGIEVYADIVLNHRFGGDEQEWLDVEEASNSRFTRFKAPRKDMFHRWGAHKLRVGRSSRRRPRHQPHFAQAVQRFRIAPISYLARFRALRTKSRNAILCASTCGMVVKRSR